MAVPISHQGSVLVKGCGTLTLGILLEEAWLDFELVAKLTLRAIPGVAVR